MVQELSQVGEYHFTTNMDNQDSICHGSNSCHFVISLADGVSTCCDGKIGAEIASKAITDLFLKKGEFFFNLDGSQLSDLVLSHVLYELKQLAIDNGHEINNYSSTLASVVYDKKKKKILCFNLGDSMILATIKGKCRVLLTPSDSRYGCFVTTTQGADHLATVASFNSDSFESVIICSDGAWKNMFTKNKLNSEVLRILDKNDYSALKEYLQQQDCFDDYSFVSLNIQNHRRKSA